MISLQRQYASFQKRGHTCRIGFVDQTSNFRPNGITCYWLSVILQSNLATGDRGRCQDPLGYFPGVRTTQLLTMTSTIAVFSPSSVRTHVSGNGSERSGDFTVAWVISVDAAMQGDMPAAETSRHVMRLTSVISSSHADLSPFRQPHLAQLERQFAEHGVILHIVAQQFQLSLALLQGGNQRGFQIHKADPRIVTR